MRRRMEDKEDGGGRGLRKMEKMDEVHRMEVEEDGKWRRRRM